MSLHFVVSVIVFVSQLQGGLKSAGDDVWSPAVPVASAWDSSVRVQSAECP